MKDQKLSQTKITNILKNYLFKTYEQQLEYGSARYEIIKFIGELSVITGQQFYRLKLDIKGIKEFIARVQPLLKDLANKDSLSEDIFEDFKRQFETKVSEQLSASREPSKGLEKEKDSEKDNRFKEKELIPMGFEEGVPMVSIEAFFKFPLGSEEEAPPEGDWFVQHQQYLNLLVEKQSLNADIIHIINEISTTFPQTKYEKYFDIFPFGSFDDGVLMTVYRLWKRNRLKQLQIEN